MRGNGFCKICLKLDPETAKQKFLQIVLAQGGKVIGEYKSCRERVDCTCSEGHSCLVLPSSINQGDTNICQICSGHHDPETYESIFIEEVTKQGGRIIGKYLGSRIPIEISCSKGHACFPQPRSITAGRGICITCSGNDTGEAQRKFIIRVAELGGEIIGKYVDNRTPIECRCASGHLCKIRPSSVTNAGHGICQQCKKSIGEILVYEACKKLDISLVYQVKDPLLPTLSFDYSLIVNDALCYIEFDGRQHFRFSGRFHRTQENFDLCRQRDLIKTYACKLKNIKLIRLAHTWSYKSVDELVEYLKKVIYDDRQLVADSPLYEDWINVPPKEEIIRKYIQDLPKP